MLLGKVFPMIVPAMCAAAPVLAEELEAPPAHIAARDSLPEEVRGMLEAAAKTEKALQVRAVAHAVREVYSEHADAIDDYSGYLQFQVITLGRDYDMVVVRHKPKEDIKAPKPEVGTAEQTVKPAPAPKFLDLGDWTGKVGASGLVATGNSRNAAAGLLVDAKLPDGDLTHNVKLYFDYGRARRAKTQQRWGAAYKLDYAISDDSFAYGRLAYNEDEFSGFDYRLFGGLGAGHWFIRSEELALSLSGGPGYQYAPIDDTRETDSHFAFYSASEFHWVIREGLKFEQNMDATWTEPTSTFLSTTSLSTAFTDALSTGISYAYRYETDPPMGRVNTDTMFRVNLNYDF